MADQKHPEDFQVTDRRRFSDTGELREDAPARDPAPPPALPPRQQAPAPPPPRPPARPAAGPPQAPPPAQPSPSPAAQQAASSYAAAGIGMKKVTFDQIILMYAQTAMLQLGLIAADPAQPLEPDLFGARQTVDALALIQEKTRGNLTPEEQHMLENTLFELRMAWLEIDRRYNRPPAKK